MTLDQTQEFLVQPVDASWLQCNIECQEACPMGTNCRGYLNLAAEGRFEEGYILSREPNPVAAMCSYVGSAPCERACRRGDIDRPLAIRAMKRFLVEWHQASGIPDDMPVITPRDTTVAVIDFGVTGDPSRKVSAGGINAQVTLSAPGCGGGGCPMTWLSTSGTQSRWMTGSRNATLAADRGRLHAVRLPGPGRFV